MLYRSQRFQLTFSVFTNPRGLKERQRLGRRLSLAVVVAGFRFLLLNSPRYESASSAPRRPRDLQVPRRECVVMRSSCLLRFYLQIIIYSANPLKGYIFRFICSSVTAIRKATFLFV